jgi:release factor glutamine methyltransferase
MMRTTRLRGEIDRAAAVLAEAGVASPRADAEELAAFVAGTSRGRLPMIDAPGNGSGAEFVGRYADLVAARARRIPLQHLTGTAAFGPLTLQVGPGVFIPRPETESLLAWATDQSLPSNPLIVDLCTGCGALAIALARHRPGARVIAVDNSTAALDYARRNAAGTHVELHDADVTDPELLPQLDGRIDLIVANPPYIPDGADLEPEVAEHDPSQALFGGPDGMAVITPIVRLVARWLRPGGKAGIEHDETTSEATVELLRAERVFGDITPHKDLAGRPRFVTATKRTDP